MTQADDESGENRFRRVLEAYGGVGFTEGNAVERLRNGVEIFPAMLDAIARAEHRIDFVTFIYWTGNIAREMAAALAERARAGVAVHILLDAVGARLMRKELIEEMKDAGATVGWFRPVGRWKVWEVDHRTHRKILVIDDDVAFTGGVGIAEEWEGDAESPDSWRDSHFSVRGPAVDALRSTFIADWRNAKHPMFDSWVPPRPRPAGDTVLGVVDSSAQIELNPAGRMFEAILQTVEDRVWVTTPYFNPSDRVTDLLVEAAHRGVDVRVMIPGPHIDKRVCRVVAEGHAVDLVEEGVSVYRYQPTMLHLKQLVADDSLAVFGSVNLNERSMYKDEEVAVVAIDMHLNDLLAADFEADMESCVVAESLSDIARTPTERTVDLLVKPFRGEF
jgi:cardiolipin synthase A/B